MNFQKIGYALANLNSNKASQILKIQLSVFGLNNLQLAIDWLFQLKNDDA